MQDTESSFFVYQIVGPTAVGKTQTALWLADQLISAKKYTEVEIISADSRQVYRELSILSGADIPKNWEEIQVPELSYSSFQAPGGTLRAHGVRMVSCTEEWSAAHFVSLAQEVLDFARGRKHGVIVVGGTGLYLQQLFAPAASLGVSPDEKLRSSLETLTVLELQAQLAHLSPARLEQMNNSDRNNPRRLMRALEIAHASHRMPIGQTDDSSVPHSRSEVDNQKNTGAAVVTIGLIDDLAAISDRITTRVEERFSQGARQEVQNVLDSEQLLSKTALTTLGIKEVAAFLHGDIELNEAIQLWSQRERQYAKRQLTWLKKYAHAQWFSVNSAAHISAIQALLQLK